MSPAGREVVKDDKTMTTSTFSLTLRSSRDLLAARHRARQMAGLLGFEPREQSFIAAAVFEIARAAFRPPGRATLKFQVTGDTLQVFSDSPAPPAPLSPWGKQTGTRLSRQRVGRLPAEPGPGAAPPLRLEKPLPKKTPALTHQDLGWAFQELARLTPLNLLEEIRQQNRELLLLFQELHQRRAEPAQAGRAGTRFSAA
jgi:hypothetical protein